jgi:hypothetical protein
MGLELVVSAAILDQDGAEPVLEGIDHGRAHTARGDTTGHAHGVDPLLGKKGGNRGSEERRRAGLDERVIDTAIIGS